MRGGNGGEFEIAAGGRFGILKADRPCGLGAQALRHKRAVGFGDNHLQARVDGAERQQRFGIEMIGVVMAGGNYVDEVKLLRSDDATGHAGMRLISGGVFLGE